VSQLEEQFAGSRSSPWQHDGFWLRVRVWLVAAELEVFNRHISADPRRGGAWDLGGFGEFCFTRQLV